VKESKDFIYTFRCVQHFDVEFNSISIELNLWRKKSRSADSLGIGGILPWAMFTK
jgi:hypothetical protein